MTTRLAAYLAIALVLEARGPAEEPAPPAAALHNLIRLPAPWPPRLSAFPKSVEKDPVTPPHLLSPPPVIAIDVGGQLFVDDSLIAETTLRRTTHLATYHPASPVLKPDRPWETRDRDHPAAMVFSDFRFHRRSGKLYSFWVSPDASGAAAAAKTP